MGFFKTNGSEDALFSTSFKLVDGIPGWGQNIFVIKAELRPDRITFYQSPIGETKTTSLFYDQIIETKCYTETEIIEKSKSVVGRSLVGTALFGPVGAIVGGMSGIGSKKAKKSSHYYTIMFTNSNNEPALLTFGTDCTPCNYHRFDAILKEHLPKKEDIQTPDFL